MGGNHFQILSRARLDGSEQQSIRNAYTGLLAEERQDRYGVLREWVLGRDVNGSECLASIAEDGQTDYGTVQSLRGLCRESGVRGSIREEHSLLGVECWNRVSLILRSLEHMLTILDDRLLQRIAYCSDGLGVPVGYKSKPGGKREKRCRAYYSCTWQGSGGTMLVATV